MLREYTVTLYLNEEITPRIFARRLAATLAGLGTIRVGERVGMEEFLYEVLPEESVTVEPFGTLTAPVISRVHP